MSDNRTRAPYVGLVAALRDEFGPAALEAMRIQLLPHRNNPSSLGTLVQAVRDANNVAFVIELAATVPPADMDEVDSAVRWMTASGIPPQTPEAIRAWLDRLGVPVPVGIHALMGEIQRAVIAAGDAGYAAAHDRLGEELARATQELDSKRVLIGHLADQLEDLSKAQCWQGPRAFASCDNDGCTYRRQLIAAARTAIATTEHSGTEAGR